MRYSSLKGLAVALITVMFGFVACGDVERENDQLVDLSQEDCGQELAIYVNSWSGGTVTCDGYTQEFEEAATIHGFCVEHRGFWFEIALKGPATLTVTIVPDSGADDAEPTPFSLDFGLPDGSTVRADYVEAFEGGTVIVTVP